MQRMVPGFLLTALLLTSPLLMLLTVVGSARGQSLGNDGLGVGLTLLAPREDAPQTLRPGSLLTARVRLATALTPPPGVQQPRALREWSAVLKGHSARSSAADVEHAYRLLVTNVRPEASRTLDYRVQIPLPAWIAPGTYSLRVGGPGGEAEAPFAVHIRVAGVPMAGATVLLPSGARLLSAQPRSSIRWFPATSVGSATQRPAVIGFGVPLEAKYAPMGSFSATPSASSAVTVVVDPSPRAGHLATLIASGLPPQSQVAWTLSDGTTAFGSPRLRHLFQSSGPFTGALVAIAPDGHATQLEFQINVAPGVRFGCQTRASLELPTGALSAAPLILALALLKRRPRRRSGINFPPKAVGGPAQCRSPRSY